MARSYLMVLSVCVARSSWMVLSLRLARSGFMVLSAGMARSPLMVLSFTFGSLAFCGAFVVDGSLPPYGPLFFAGSLISPVAFAMTG